MSQLFKLKFLKQFNTVLSEHIFKKKICLLDSNRSKECIVVICFVFLFFFFYMHT